MIFAFWAGWGVGMSLGFGLGVFATVWRLKK